jgi:hypothetical protein
MHCVEGGATIKVEKSGWSRSDRGTGSAGARHQGALRGYSFNGETLLIPTAPAGARQREQAGQPAHGSDAERDAGNSVEHEVVVMPDQRDRHRGRDEGQQRCPDREPDAARVALDQQRRNARHRGDRCAVTGREAVERAFRTSNERLRDTLAETDGERRTDGRDDRDEAVAQEHCYNDERSDRADQRQRSGEIDDVLPKARREEGMVENEPRDSELTLERPIDGADDHRQDDEHQEASGRDSQRIASIS